MRAFDRPTVGCCPSTQDHKGRQFELCPPRILPGAGGLPQILPGAGAEGQHPTVPYVRRIHFLVQDLLPIPFSTV